MAIRLVTALDGLLRIYEDYWRVMSTFVDAQIKHDRTAASMKQRAIVNFKRLRLAMMGDISSIIGTQNPFGCPAELANGDLMRLNFEAAAIQLLAWSQRSRRIFTLTSDLQGILEATDISNIRWSDLLLPFPAFAIQLADPIRSESGDSHSMLLFSEERWPSVSSRTVDRPLSRLFTAVSDSCASYRSLLPFQTRKLNEFAGRAKPSPKAVNRELNTVLKHFDNLSLYSTVLSVGSTDGVLEVLTDMGSLLQEGGQLVRRSPIGLSERMLRIVVGLALYLDTLPPGSSHSWQNLAPEERISTPDATAITNTALVAAIESTIVLTEDEREMIARCRATRSFEMRWSMRRAHTRRSPGMGHIPDAPRDVRVRACIVRADRAPEGPAVPAGGESIFL